MRAHLAARYLPYCGRESHVTRARGRFGGRPKALQADKRQLAVQLYQGKKVAVKDICALMGISKPTLYAYVRQAQGTSPTG